MLAKWFVNWILEPCLGCCVEIFSKTLKSHSASLSSFPGGPQEGRVLPTVDYIRLHLKMVPFSGSRHAKGKRFYKLK